MQSFLSFDKDNFCIESKEYILCIKKLKILYFKVTKRLLNAGVVAISLIISKQHHTKELIV